MIDTLAILILLGMADAVVSMTIAKSRMFRPLREAAWHWSRWIAELLRCPYCLAHWVAFLFVAAHAPYGNPIGFVLWSFAVVAMASLVMLGLDVFLERIDR